MTRNRFAAAVVVLVTAPLLWTWPGASAEAAAQAGGQGVFEVWIADQSDTAAGFGGQLLIYEGAGLMGEAAAKAMPTARIDLALDTAALCMKATGRNPV